MEKPAISRMHLRNIASPTNALLKVFRKALAEGTTRDGWVAVEGPRLVEEAIRTSHRQAENRCQVRSVLVSEDAVGKFRGLLARMPPEAEVASVPGEIFCKLAQTETPQGIAALVELGKSEWDQCLKREDALLVMACGIQDPGNLGAILRTAEAMGATAVAAARGTVSLFNPKVVRSSGGALFRLPVFALADFQGLMDELSAADMRSIAASSAAGISIAQADLKGRLAILVGSEAAGVSPEVARQASALVRIPMKPGVDSLNAAVAASIFLYEAQRQRGFRFEQYVENAQVPSSDGR
jgi:TrmH family RNA methyltransferase